MQLYLAEQDSMANLQLADLDGGVSIPVPSDGAFTTGLR